MLRTAGVFFESPTKRMYLADISRKIGLAHTSVKRNLGSLLRLNIITEEVEKRGSRRFPAYKANMDTQEYRIQKQLFNISSIKESGLIQYLQENIMPRSIVLFGSYWKGEDTEASDIDLYIEAPKAEVMLDKFEKLLKRKLQLHFNESFASFPKELKNNIINGVVLSGYLEALK
jgi:predicted nucleotidyltransferase